jgi:hypothetical protein
MYHDDRPVSDISSLPGILWMLWLSTGIDGADSTTISFQGGCDGYVNST